MAAWKEQLLNLLARQPICGYRPRGSAASEPTALAALALIAHGQIDQAESALDWLSQRQAADGSVGINADHPTPCWPTALALFAWQAAAKQSRADYRKPIQLARQWLLSMEGVALPRSKTMGHDSLLVGWPWVDGTHSWLEPTAWSVLALKAAGNGDQPRVREGVRLIADRLLPSGGCNYGNTIVLGNQLLPHIQPTGLALWALAGECDVNGRIAASKRWLAGEINAHTASASLAYAVIGLRAQGAAPADADLWLRTALDRLCPKETAGHKLALLALAACDDTNPLHLATRTT